MTLSDYLKSTGETDGAFAARAGISRGKVNAYKLRQLVPGSRSIQRIRVATDGRVTFEDFFPPLAGGRVRKTRKAA